MISGGKPVCPSCVPYFREPAPCTACGTPSTRLSRAPSLGVQEKICDACRNKLTHQTCAVCRKYRKVVGTTDDGKPYCDSCQPGHETSHSCPGCQTHVAGTGASLCRACQNGKRLAQEVQLNQVVFAREWMPRLYSEFANWLHYRQGDAPTCLKTFRAHQPFFERLDAEYSALTDITPESLLVRCSSAYLRRHLLATQFLQEALGFTIKPEQKAHYGEMETVRLKLLESKKEPWGSLLVNYVNSLNDAQLPIRTIRLYLSAAHAFCVHAKATEKGWESRAPLKFLKANPGARNNLSRFISHCARTYGWDVALPTRKQLPGKRAIVPKTVMELRTLLQKVQKTGEANASKHDLARILAKSLGLSVGDVMALSAEHFQQTANQFNLLVAQEVICLPKELHAIAQRFLLK